MPHADCAVSTQQVMMPAPDGTAESSMPASVFTGSTSAPGSHNLIFRFVPKETGSAQRGLFNLTNFVRLGVAQNGGGPFLFRGTWGSSTPRNAFAAFGPTSGNDTLVGLQWDASASRGRIRVIDATNALSSVQTSAAPAGWGPWANWPFGTDGASFSALQHYAGPLIFLDKTISDAEFQAIWDARDLFAARRLHPSNVKRMFMFLKATDPPSGAISYIGGDPGGSDAGAHKIKTDNFIWENPDSGTTPGDIFTPRSVVSVTGDWVHVSPRDAAFTGKFPVHVPGILTGLSPTKVGLTGILKSYLDGNNSAGTVVHCLDEANSRGRLYSNSPNHRDPTNTAARRGDRWSSGRGENNLERWGGFCWVDSSASGRAQDFGTTLNSAPYTSNVSGLLANIIGTGDAREDFKRFVPGSSTSSNGPGNGVYLGPGDAIKIAFRDEPGSALLRTQPANYRVYLPKFPGASQVGLEPYKSTTSGALGTSLASEITITMDNTVTSGVVGGTPAANTVPIVDPDLSIHDAVQVGWLVALATDLTDVHAGIGVITGKSASGGVTTFTVSHNFREIAVSGDVARFGPLEWVGQDVAFAAQSEGELSVFQGVRVRAIGGHGLYFPGFGVWTTRTDMAGVFTSSGLGWSGNGYDPQLDGMFTNSFRRWIAVLPDKLLWFCWGAQQNTAPSDVWRVVDEIRASKNSLKCEIYVMGDPRHDSESWGGFSDLDFQEEIRDEGDSKSINGYCSIFEDTAVGDLLERGIAGYQRDGAHPNIRGYRQMIAETDAMLATIATVNPSSPPGTGRAAGMSSSIGIGI